LVKKMSTWLMWPNIVAKKRIDDEISIEIKERIKDKGFIIY